MSGTTTTRVPAQTRTGAPPEGAAADPAAAAAVPNAGAELAALAGRVQGPWRAVLGGLIEGAGAVPELDAFKLSVFRQVRSNPVGVEDARNYMDALGVDRSSYKSAFTQTREATTADAPHLTTIQTVTQWFTGNGDLPTANLRLLTAHAQLSATGKRWLAQATDILQPLERYGEGQAYTDGISGDDPVHVRTPRGEARRAGSQALLRLLRNQGGGGAAAAADPAAPAAPPGPTDEQRQAWRTQADEIKSAIEEVLPAAEPAAPAADHAALTARRSARTAVRTRDVTAIQRRIHAAPTEVRDLLYADPTLMQRLTQALTPEQLVLINHELDSVEQLYDACMVASGRAPLHEGPQRDTPAARPAGGEGAFGLLRQYLLGHPGSEGLPARQRVLRHARLMDDVYELLSTENQDLIQRLIARGTEAPSAEDRVHQAATAGDKAALARAILEMASTDRAHLMELRDNLVFRSAVQRCSEAGGGEPVEANGVQVRPYDLLLQLWGLSPADTRDPGTIDRQREVNPDAANELPLNGEQTRQLNTELFDPAVGPLARELSSSMYIDDAVVLRILRAFAVTAAQPAIRDFLRRGQLGAGHELERRANAQVSGGSCRQKLNEGCSDETRQEAERVLGIRVDAAAIGTIDGQARLATDGSALASGTGRIPLDQALRETLCGTQTLSQYIHAKALEMAGELNESWASGYADSADVLAIWRGYLAGVEPHVPALQTSTGTTNIHPVELLANAFVEVGGGTLQSKLNESLDADERPQVLPVMHMRAEDVSARAVQGTEGVTAEVAAERVTSRAGGEQMATAARELFATMTRLGPMSQREDFEAAGRALREKLALPALDAPVTAALPPAGARLPGARAGGPAAVQSGGVDTAAPRAFRDFYRRDFGMDPTRHAVELVRSLGDRAHIPTSTAATLMQLPADQISAAPVLPDEPVINESNRHLCRPDFTIADARTRAENIWRTLHGAGQIQLITNELEGRTQEEQRLIHIFFRRLSGDIDLRFYLEQARAQQTAIAGGGPHTFSSVGARGSDEGQHVAGASGTRIHVAGDLAEIDQIRDLAATGAISVEVRMRAAADANNMDELYRLVEGATEAERRRVLVDSPLMARLRGFCDDGYEWDRVYKTLTGQADLTDRLQSRAHGEHGLIGGMFDNTDETRMRSDIQDYMRQRRRDIRAELQRSAPRGENGQPVAVTDAQVNARVREDCQRLMANPDVRAIIEAELSGFERSQTEGLVLNAGEESADARVLTEGDLTENEEQIIASIRTMPPAERARRRTDPAYLRRLHALCDTEEQRRDAMNALFSDVEPGTDDHLSSLEQASRSADEVSTDMRFQVEDVLEHLTHLSLDEYRSLQANPRLQAQVMRAVAGDPARAALVRQALAFRFPDAAAESGITPSTAAEGTAPQPGEIPVGEVQRIAYLRFNAVQRMNAACTLGWDTLLSEAIAIYGFNLRPAVTGNPAARDGGATGEVSTGAVRSGSASESGGGRPAAPGTLAPPRAAGPVPATVAEQHETRLRREIWDEVHGGVATRVRALGVTNDLGTDTMVNLIRDGVLGVTDPTNERIHENAGPVSDDESGIANTIRAASDDHLILRWTTVCDHAPNGGDSLRDIYRNWRGVREAMDSAGESQPDMVQRERDLHMRFTNHVIDTSQGFEQLLLSHAGGAFADSRATGDGERRTRDNAEWLEWRTIIRERIPRLDASKIARHIGASDDAVASREISNPNRTALQGLAFAEENYEVARGADSNYNMDRLTAGGEGQRLDRAMGDYRAEVGNSLASEDPAAYNQVTADETARIGERSTEFDAALGNFRAAKSRVADIAAAVVGVLITVVVTILTAGTATGPAMVILLGMMTGAAAGMGQALTREAIMGSGYELGNEGLREIATQAIMGAVTAGAQYYAGSLIQGLSRAGTMAQQAETIGAGALVRPPVWRSLLAEAGEEALQTSMEGVVEAGGAAIDPTHWMHGWDEGWRRGRDAGMARLARVPGEAIQAATVAALTQGIMMTGGAVHGRLTGASARSTTDAAEREGRERAEDAIEDGAARRGRDEARQQLDHDAARAAEGATDTAADATGTATRREGADAAGDATGSGHHGAVASPDQARHQASQGGATDARHHAVDEGANPAEAAARMTLRDRAGRVVGQAIEDIPESLAEGVAERLVNEETWRAEGLEARAIAGDLAMGILDGFKDVANETHIADANVAVRSRRGAVELARHRAGMTPSQQRAYMHAVVEGEGPQVISAATFMATRNAAVSSAVSAHQTRIGRELTPGERTAFERFVHAAATSQEFNERSNVDPLSVPEVRSAGEADRRAADDATAAASTAAAAETRRAEQADPATPARAELASVTAAGAAAVEARGQAQGSFDAAVVSSRRATAALAGLPRGATSAGVITEVEAASAAMGRAENAARTAIEAALALETARIRLESALRILAASTPVGGQQDEARAALYAQVEAARAALAAHQQAAHHAATEAANAAADAQRHAVGAETAARLAASRAPAAQPVQSGGDGDGRPATSDAPTPAVVPAPGPQQQTAGPQQQTAGPQQQTAGPQQQTAGPQQQTAGPQQQTGQPGELTPRAAQALGNTEGEEQARRAEEERRRLAEHGEQAQTPAQTPSQQQGQTTSQQQSVTTGDGQQQTGTPGLQPVAGPHPGVELHNHFMGVAPVSVFRNAVPGGTNIALLAEIHRFCLDPGDERARPVIAATRGVVERAQGEIATKLAEAEGHRGAAAALEPTSAEAQEHLRLAAELAAGADRIAGEAINQALNTSDDTPFDSAYEVRDHLIKQFIDRDSRNGENAAGGRPNARSYTNFTIETLKALIRDGVFFSEQSMSLNKLKNGAFNQSMMREALDQAIEQLAQEDERYADPAMQARIREGSVRWLVMLDTKLLAGQSTEAESRSQLGEVQQQLARPDTMGVDFASPEKFEFNAAGQAVFIQTYLMLQQAAQQHGRVLVLRPHVGEGYGQSEAGQPFDARNTELGPDGKPLHYGVAEHNVEMLLQTLEQLKAAGAFSGDPARDGVIVRFGHATHTTPAQAARLAALGIVAEVNLTSNVRTGSVDQRDAAEGAERFNDHAFLNLIFNQVTVILSTDAQSVMSTDMQQEYDKAQKLLEAFLAGDSTVSVPTTGEDGRVSYEEMKITDPRFPADRIPVFQAALVKLHADAIRYRESVTSGDRSDRRTDDQGMTRGERAAPTPGQPAQGGTQQGPGPEVGPQSTRPATPQQQGTAPEQTAATPIDWADTVDGRTFKESFANFMGQARRVERQGDQLVAIIPEGTPTRHAERIRTLLAAGNGNLASFEDVSPDFDSLIPGTPRYASERALVVAHFGEIFVARHEAKHGVVRSTGQSSGLIIGGVEQNLDGLPEDTQAEARWMAAELENHHLFGPWLRGQMVVGADFKRLVQEVGQKQAEMMNNPDPEFARALMAWLVSQKQRVHRAITTTPDGERQEQQGAQATDLSGISAAARARLELLARGGMQLYESASAVTDIEQQHHVLERIRAVQETHPEWDSATVARQVMRDLEQASGGTDVGITAPLIQRYIEIRQASLDQRSAVQARLETGLADGALADIIARANEMAQRCGITGGVEVFVTGSASKTGKELTFKKGADLDVIAVARGDVSPAQLAQFEVLFAGLSVQGRSADRKAETDPEFIPLPVDVKAMTESQFFGWGATPTQLAPDGKPRSPLLHHRIDAPPAAGQSGESGNDGGPPPGPDQGSESRETETQEPIPTPDERRDGAPPPDPHAPATAPERPPLPPVRTFAEAEAVVRAMRDWHAIQEAFLPRDEASMKVLVEYRTAWVDRELNAIKAKHGLTSESPGSVKVTSDYDISLKGDKIAPAIAEFNQKFRATFGMEAGTAFDTNVYDAGDSLTSRTGAGTQISADNQEAVLQNEELQDIAGLVKVRKYMTEEEFKQYGESLLAAIPRGGMQGEMVRLQLKQRLAEANRIQNEVDAAIDDKYKELRADGTNAKRSDADLRLMASNVLYAEALEDVDAAKARQLAAIQAAQADPTNPELKAQVDTETLAYRRAQANALNYASEAYNSEGAVVDVVGKQAKLNLPLTNQDRLSSMNEQFGDARKDLDHHGDHLGTAGVKVSKYVMRFLAAVEAIRQSAPLTDEQMQAIKSDLKKLQKMNPALKEIRDNPTTFDEDTARAMVEKAGITSASQYAEILQKINVHMNAMARQARPPGPAPESSGGGDDGGGGPDNVSLPPSQAAEQSVAPAVTQPGPQQSVPPEAQVATPTQQPEPQTTAQQTAETETRQERQSAPVEDTQQPANDNDTQADEDKQKASGNALALGQFHGAHDDANLTMADVVAIAKGRNLPVLPPGARYDAAENCFYLPDVGGGEVRVLLLDPQPLGQGPDAPVAERYWPGGSADAHIIVSSGALKEDVARALAHELRELAAMIADGNATDAATHEQGRVGELGVLFAQLQATSTTGTRKGTEGPRAEHQRVAAQIREVLADLRIDPARLESDAEYAAEVAKRVGQLVVLQVLKMQYLLSSDYKPNDIEPGQQGVQIHGTDTRLGQPGGEGHIMATDPSSGMHASFAPVSANIKDTEGKDSEEHKKMSAKGRGNSESSRVVPFHGAPEIPFSARPGMHHDLENDQYMWEHQGRNPVLDAKGQKQKAVQDFGHTFDPQFIDPGALASIVEAARAVEEATSVPPDFVLATSPDAQLRATNCGTVLMSHLRQLTVRQADGSTTPMFDDNDFAMLGLESNGLASAGRDVRPQDIFQHLRWKEAMWKKARQAAGSEQQSSPEPAESEADPTDTED